MTTPEAVARNHGPSYELMPLIDIRRPPGEQQIVGWATRCLNCLAPIHKTETTAAAQAWMHKHDWEHRQ
jgi:hypothetical protein